jgi:hypothetical protein
MWLALVLLANGVGYIVTAVRRFNPPALPEHPGPPVPSDFVGVGHFLTAVASPSPLFALAPLRL